MPTPDQKWWLDELGFMELRLLRGENDGRCGSAQP
jgi:hypothetical protein